MKLLERQSILEKIQLLTEERDRALTMVRKSYIDNINYGLSVCIISRRGLKMCQIRILVDVDLKLELKPKSHLPYL